MERVGIYFKLKPGSREEYIKQHQNIWPKMREVLNRAGICNYSIWNEGNMLFAYYEVSDKAYMEKVLQESEVYNRWRKLMEKYIYQEEETGKKEWFMEMVFLNKGLQ